MEGVRRGTYVRLPVRRLGLVPNTRTELNCTEPVDPVTGSVDWSYWEGNRAVEGVRRGGKVRLG